jgi:hypothetical protein
VDAKPHGQGRSQIVFIRDYFFRPCHGCSAEFFPQKTYQKKILLAGGFLKKTKRRKIIVNMFMKYIWKSAG